MKDALIEDLIQDFYKGLTVKELTEKYAERYEKEDGKKLYKKTVSVLLQSRANPAFLAEYKDRMECEVMRMKKEGCNTKRIAMVTGIGEQTVAHIIKSKEKCRGNGITMLEVLTYKDTVEVGDVLHISYLKQEEGVTGLRYKRVHETITVTGKYKHICTTTGGDIRWVDLYRYTRGIA